MSALDDWVDSVHAALHLSQMDDHAEGGYADKPDDIRLVLDVARDVAHGVMRPAAPVTAYLMGVAVGQGADPATVAGVVTQLARRWPGGEPPVPA